LSALVIEAGSVESIAGVDSFIGCCVSSDGGDIDVGSNDGEFVLVEIIFDPSGLASQASFDKTLSGPESDFFGSSFSGLLS
jgi:hypothetical protein